MFCRYISRVDKKSGARYNVDMDEQLYNQVRERVAEVCKGHGYGEVRIIIEKNRLRWVRTVIDECVEDRQMGSGRLGTAQVT